MNKYFCGFAFSILVTWTPTFAEVSGGTITSSGIVRSNESFSVEWDLRNGGLRSLVLNGDDDRMNWIEGIDRWGEIRTRALGVGGWNQKNFLDTHKLRFKEIREEDGRIVSVYDNGILRAEVGRSLAKDALREEYVFTNVSKVPLYFNRGDLGISATFNDGYPDADECIRRRCNAHVWCGGENSWIRAVKMGPGSSELALVLTGGSLDWYSIRRPVNGSGIDRGDIVLHPDPFVLEPGKTMRIAWNLVAYKEGKFKEALLRNGGAMIEFENETIFPNEKFQITITENTGTRLEVRSPEKGVGEYPFVFKLADGRMARANGFCSPAFDDLLKARVRFIVEKQQCLDPSSPLYGAFLPYDNEDEHQYFSAGWRDMNACRERTAMPIMLARYLQRHGEDHEARRALDLWEEFACREFFDTESCAIFDGLGKSGPKRLYNGPQLIGFWKELYLLKKDPKYLDRIEKSVLEYYRAGGTNFYPNGCNFAEQYVMLKKAGYEAIEYEARFREHVANLVRNGLRPPAHEARFEQSIMSPAVTILSAHQMFVEKRQDIAAILPELVDVLWRFNGNQPDYRLNETAIRHWDGYWFGKRHTYGDTLHQHSALSARSFMQYARVSGDPVWRKRAEHTYRNVLAMFTPDGRGTGAYMLPLTVTMVNEDGTAFSPTRRVLGPDPLANDQDSALYNCMGSGLFGDYGEPLFY